MRTILAFGNAPHEARLYGAHEVAVLRVDYGRVLERVFLAVLFNCGQPRPLGAVRGEGMTIQAIRFEAVRSRPLQVRTKANILRLPRILRIIPHLGDGHHLEVIPWRHPTILVV